MICEALTQLGIKDFVIYGEPTTEKELRECFYKVTGKDSYDNAILVKGYIGVSWNQIQAKIAELQADYDFKQYQRDRANAYPSWQEQLDNIFHNGIDAWKADIQAIKDQFPKP